MPAASDDLPQAMTRGGILSKNMHQGKIIIADDDAALRLDLRHTLEAPGHAIIGEADNGETACHLARRLNPDLIILDVMMPGLNGLEAARIIGQERLGPILMLPGYSDVPLLEQASRAGVLAYLVKLFRQQEVQPAVEIAITRWRERGAYSERLQYVPEETLPLELM